MSEQPIPENIVYRWTPTDRDLARESELYGHKDFRSAKMHCSCPDEFVIESRPDWSGGICIWGRINARSGEAERWDDNWGGVGIRFLVNHLLGKLTGAYNEANDKIYFADSNGYIKGLFSICELIKPGIEHGEIYSGAVHQNQDGQDAKS